MSLSSLTKGQIKSQSPHHWLEAIQGLLRAKKAREPGSLIKRNVPPVVFPVESQHGEEDVLVTDG